MPIQRFPSLAEAERQLARTTDPSTGVRTALFLARLDAASRLGVRVTQIGLHRYRSLAEGEADRERHALAMLRAAGL